MSKYNDIKIIKYYNVLTCIFMIISNVIKVNKCVAYIWYDLKQWDLKYNCIKHKIYELLQKSS